MKIHWFGAAITILALSLSSGDATAQSILKSIEKRTEDATKQKAVDTGVKMTGKAIDAVTCDAVDLACQEKARAEGKAVVIDSTAAATPATASATSTSGTVAGGSSAADTTAGAKPLPRPGEGAWANYDFKPDDRVLFADDLSGDNVGDFPRRLEFVGGNMEIVEWNGARWLRAGGRGDFILPLSEPLPERFTLEFDLAGFGNGMEVHFVEPGTNPWQMVTLNQTVGGIRRNGLEALGESGYNTGKETVTARITADGRYVKVYINETRVANVPNANRGGRTGSGSG